MKQTSLPENVKQMMGIKFYPSRIEMSKEIGLCVSYGKPDTLLSFCKSCIFNTSALIGEPECKTCYVNLAIDKTLREKKTEERISDESADRLKSDFLSIVSHELRTPLVSIIGYNELLLDGITGSLNEEQINALRKIEKNSRKLLESIDTMLEFSLLESNPPDLKVIKVSALIEEVKLEIQHLFEKSNLDFTILAGPELHLRTDTSKLKVVIKNLFSNAVKFTEKGGVTVEVESKNGVITISIIDTGIGIPMEAFGVIFKPFCQLENPLTREHDGAGLGLYIVKRFLDIMGGTIEVESEIGCGSKFTVRIPESPLCSSVS